MNHSIGMPFSGGQDSIMNLILQIKEDSAPIHLFYFRMGTPTSLVEEGGVKSIVPRIIKDLTAEDIRLHFVDAFNLRGLSQEPNPFVPFRNAFFAQYIMGLGFKKILFSFSAEDTLFYDASDEFMGDMRFFAKKNLGTDVNVYTHTRQLTRIGYMRTVIDLYGYNSRIHWMLKNAHVCASPVPCRACICCLLREIADMWAIQTYNKNTMISDTKQFIKHWQGHTTVRDFYKRVITGDFHDEIARDEYWKFLEQFEKGALLKGLAL